MSFTYKSIRAEKERTGCHADDIFFFKLLYNVKKKKKNPLRNHHLIKMSPNRTRKYLG